MDRILIGEASEVVVGRGLLSTSALLPEREGRRRAAVLTQPGALDVARGVRRRLEDEGLESALRVLPDREEAKTLEVAGEVFEWLTDLGLGRGDTVVGVGGGALTDLAGFVAATYLRGVEVVHVPTTLLGAVDAAVGGKTGVNLRGKNLVGAFWHPSRVVVDVLVLEGLPGHLLRTGLAEALKAGLVGDPGLVALLEAEGPAAPLEQVVARSVRVKAAVVSADFREEGRRAILNYGHTVGHAVEVAAGLAHGEAVALGMVAAGEVSRREVGFEESGRVVTLLESLGLPVRSPPVDADRVRDLLALDKKREAGGLRMVLLRSVGEAVVRPVDTATVEAALTSIGVR